jgi:hypothetical protein
MHQLKWRLSAMLLLYPMTVFAHGEDVFITLFIQATSVILFLVVLFLMKRAIKFKSMLAVADCLAVLIIRYWSITIPYFENTKKINIVVFVVPLMAVLSVIVALRFFFKKLTSLYQTYQQGVLLLPRLNLTNRNATVFTKICRTQRTSLLDTIRPQKPTLTNSWPN